MSKIPDYSIISAIRTIRTEQNLPYDEALIKAVEFFKKKDWEIPEPILTIYRRKVK